MNKKILIALVISGAFVSNTFCANFIEKVHALKNIVGLWVNTESEKTGKAISLIRVDGDCIINNLPVPVLAGYINAANARTECEKWHPRSSETACEKQKSDLLKFHAQMQVTMEKCMKYKK